MCSGFDDDIFSKELCFHFSFFGSDFKILHACQTSAKITRYCWCWELPNNQYFIVVESCTFFLPLCFINSLTLKRLSCYNKGKESHDNHEVVSIAIYKI